MTKTMIYKNKIEFDKRTDKRLNGVSEAFAKANPDYKADNDTNEGCWNCKDCSYCFGCYECSYSCGCFDCFRCSDCYDCSRCSHCFRCSHCYDSSDIRRSFDIPVIENIHQAVLKAASQEEALDMSQWHTCDTTHCRAGWVVTLAGEKGKKLEEETSSLFAAMMIYKKSSPSIRVSAIRFFDDDKAAMVDMERCAAKEKELNEGKC